MSDTLFCSLVTPKACLLSEPVWQVTVPGAAGRFSIRRDHAPIVASINDGVLEIAVGEHDRRHYSVKEGIVCCRNNRCTILCPAAETINVAPDD